MKIFAIQHRTCGHIGVASNNRAMLEHRLDHLQAAGYHQWRIRAVDDAWALEQLLADTQCDTCRLDPTRAQLLVDELGRCTVCHGQGTDGWIDRSQP